MGRKRAVRVPASEIKAERDELSTEIGFVVVKSVTPADDGLNVSIEMADPGVGPYEWSVDRMVQVHR